MLKDEESSKSISNSCSIFKCENKFINEDYDILARE